MSYKSAYRLVQGMSFRQYRKRVEREFVELFGDWPYQGYQHQLRFWYSINVHPDSAAAMLPSYGY